MDLSKFDLTANAEAGFSLVIKSPLDGSDTDAMLHIVGSDSKAYRKARTEAVRASARDSDLDADDISAKVYAACITGWENVTNGDKPIEYSYEEALAMLRKLPWLMDQVGAAIETRANFTKPIEKA